MWIATAIVFAAGIAVFIWFRRFLLEVSGNVLRYRSLLGGTKEIRFDDIRTTRIESGFPHYRDRFRPTLRMIVLPKEGAGAAPFDINLKVFEKIDIDRLVEILSRAAKAERTLGGAS